LQTVKADAESNGAVVTTYAFDLADNKQRQAVTAFVRNAQTDV